MVVTTANRLAIGIVVAGSAFLDKALMHHFRQERIGVIVTNISKICCLIGKTFGEERVDRCRVKTEFGECPFHGL